MPPIQGAEYRERLLPDYGPDAAWRMTAADAEMLRRVGDPDQPVGKATLRAGMRGRGIE